jgi:hypothetical protein
MDSEFLEVLASVPDPRDARRLPVHLGLVAGCHDPGDGCRDAQLRGVRDWGRHRVVGNLGTLVDVAGVLAIALAATMAGCRQEWAIDRAGSPIEIIVVANQFGGRLADRPARCVSDICSDCFGDHGLAA